MVSKKIIALLLGLSFFSCTPIRYLSEPVYQSPGIGLDQDRRIIIAKDKLILSKMMESDKCFEGILSTMKKYEHIKIVESIDFGKRVDSKTLMQLKDRYNLDGLLLLTNIYDQPMTNIEQGLSQACAGCPQNFIFDYDVNMTSTWEYFDFTTGRTFGYTVKNNKSGKGIQVQSPDDINTALSQIKEQLLVENGQISISKLIGI